MAKTKRSENDILYPIEYNGRLYYREDCDELFVQFYTNEDILSADCSICVSDGLWLYPDGSSYDEEMDEYRYNHEDEE
ncbi:MAG TPA: hypothetical protein PLV06_11395 [Bacteroidales bacterium]|nr:hypothetical protein [Bacteroidales bacterium]HPR12981.1 hypothetical protein [Bacteroidales bacterium]HRW85362.1 hypothetical protein [Bacteroidales bacterium]